MLGADLRGRIARIAFDRGGLLGAIVLVVYVWLAPTHVVDGDNSEFSSLGMLGGPAHPPGYPLYVMYLRAMSWLPGSSPAHTAAIATAILGAASILALHAACRAWGARPIAATISCALFAGAPVVMTLYTEAEVFALNGLVIAVLLWLSADHGPLRGARRAFALGLVAGLGLANQHTCVLLAPVGIVGVARGVREASWRALPLALAGMVLGLLPYAYLLVAAENPASWAARHSIGGVLDMFLRRDYGGPGTFAARGQAAPIGPSLAALAETLGRTWWYVGGIAGVVALGDRIARRAPGDREPRAGWIALLASFMLSGPLLAMRFNIPAEGMGLYVAHRFHIQPALLLAIPVADAIDRVAPYVRWQRREVGAALAALGFLAIAGTSLPHVARVHVPAVEYQVLNTLRSLPAGAVVITYDDDLGEGINYAQRALGVRLDVDAVHEPLLVSAWYRARVAARGFQLDGIIDGAIARGRPVFAQRKKELMAELPTYPYGILMRVLPRGSKLPSVAEVIAINQDVFAHFVMPYARPGSDDEWPTVIHKRYARTWESIAGELEHSGYSDEAARAHAFAREIGPEP